MKTDHLGHIYPEGFYVSSKLLKYVKCTCSSRFCEEQAESGARGLQVYGKYINYLGDFCQLLTFGNSLDPDQAQQKASHDQYPKPFDTLGPWFKIVIFISWQAVQALNRCSDCVYPVTTFFRK